MSFPPGTLVEVIRGPHCCGISWDIGNRFITTKISSGFNLCTACGKKSLINLVEVIGQPDDSGFADYQLRRIPPEETLYNVSGEKELETS